MNQIKDKTFMFTGTLSVTRDEAKRVVEELGGIAGSSVSKSTDYLVCGSDQVGKSGKWEKAGILGITRVDEDFFWDLVKEARKEEVVEEGEVVHLSPEEMETGDITDEHWIAIAKLGVPVMTGEQFERLLKAFAPSYENPEKLEKLVKEHNLKLLPPVTCKFCQSTIPYSIRTKTHVYYCFNCNQYQDRHTHECVWFDPQVVTGVYMCNFCGEFTKMKGRHFLDYVNSRKDDIYSSSVECLVYRMEREEQERDTHERVDKFLEGVHLSCDDFEPLGIESETGFLVKCKVCRKVKFVAFDEIDASEKLEDSGKLGEVLAGKSSHIGQSANITANMGETERQKLWGKFEKWAAKKLS